MSNKNLSQSITEAWKTAVETGQQLDENKQKREQEVSKIFDSARTDVIQHVLENDHGFYRPDVDPFFSAVDGGMLRRQRLDENESGTGVGGGLTDKEREKIDKEEKGRNIATEAELERRQKEAAAAAAQAATGINPDSERYRGRENEARVRGDIDFDPTAPGAQREVRAGQVLDNLNKTRRVFRGGRRLTGGYAGPGVNYGGAVAVGQMAPRELSPEERERQRQQQADRSRAGARERLDGLDAARRERLEKGLGPDADLDTVTTAIARERGGQDRVSDLDNNPNYVNRPGEEMYDTETGKLTDLGRQKREVLQGKAEARRDKVRAKAKARRDKAQAEADARSGRLAARREAREKERVSRTGTPVAGKTPDIAGGKKKDEIDHAAIGRGLINAFGGGFSSFFDSLTQNSGS